jgi:hypothetical protein
MKRVRGRLTFANVMSTIAVFLALGGGVAVAAGLAKNSVKSKQIKAGAVKRAELAANSVTAPKVANGSLLGEDFAAGQLPSGPTGPIGPTGPAGVEGQAGATSVQTREGPQVTVPAGGGNTATASCLAGERAVGGGWRIFGGVSDLNDYENAPTPETGTPTGWEIVLYAPTGAASVRAYVICVQP